MNTARQATENMEYVRRLLDEKQAGFAASVELAVSVMRRQIERPEENDGTGTAAWMPRDHREARPRARVARGPAGAPGHPLAGGPRLPPPGRLAPDGGAGAVGLPLVARTLHPPWSWPGSAVFARCAAASTTRPSWSASCQPRFFAALGHRRGRGRVPGLRHPPRSPAPPASGFDIPVQHQHRRFVIVGCSSRPGWPPCSSGATPESNKNGTQPPSPAHPVAPGAAGPAG